MTGRRGLWMALAVLALAAPVGADVIFPARLDVVETESGTYRVTFTLPFMEGRVLRAVPAMPPTCRDVTPRESAASASGVTTTWTAVCDPGSLAGEAILVEGLLGTQTDLAFSLATLDGRLFKRLLRPSRPGILVPHPPSLVELAAGAGLPGIRWVLGLVPLWLLVLVTVLSGARPREVGYACLTFAMGTGLAFWLVSRDWLDVPVPVRDAFLLLTALIPAVRLAGAGAGWSGWIRPAWAVAWLIGALCGGAAGEVVVLDGLSHGERFLALGFATLGAALGVALMAATATELRAVTATVGGGRWTEGLTRMTGTGLGAVAAGLLMAHVIALGLLARGFPSEPFALVLVATAIGPLLVGSGAGGWWSIPVFGAAAGVGLWAGLARVAPPLPDLMVAAVLLPLGAIVILGRGAPARWLPAVGVTAAAVCAWSGTHALVENVARSSAASVALLLLAVAVAWASHASARRLSGSGPSISGWILGGALAVWALAGRLPAYGAWWEDVVVRDASLGLVRIPLLTLVILSLAVLLWPRRRRVLDELGLRRRTSMSLAHWVAVVVALLVVPHGTVTVPWPFHEPALEAENARRVAEALLSDTYYAFNLTDEDELYDRLSASVTGNLVDDLFLDSRRRLTAGTREGAEVTVRDVEVLDLGARPYAPAGTGSFAYDTRWVVTSRVRHLQHIHYRRNIYTGVLTLSQEAGRWKIARVELTAEDRVVIPGQIT